MLLRDKTCHSEHTQGILLFYALNKGFFLPAVVRMT